MASQVDLATTAGFSVVAFGRVPTGYRLSGLSTSMFSPVRMAIVCGLAGTPGMESGCLSRHAAAFAVMAMAVLRLLPRFPWQR